MQKKNNKIQRSKLIEEELKKHMQFVICYQKRYMMEQSQKLNGKFVDQMKMVDSIALIVMEFFEIDIMQEGIIKECI